MCYSIACSTEGFQAMARPSRGEVLALAPFVKLQETYFQGLVEWCEFIASPEALAATQDDTLFIQMLSASIQLYGVKKARLAERLEKSPATIGRWEDGASLPPVYGRPAIMQVVASIMREHIENEQARKSRNDAQNRLTLLRGKVAD